MSGTPRFGVSLSVVTFCEDPGSYAYGALTRENSLCKTWGFIRPEQFLHPADVSLLSSHGLPPSGADRTSVWPAAGASTETKHPAVSCDLSQGLLIRAGAPVACGRCWFGCAFTPHCYFWKTGQNLNSKTQLVPGFLMSD